MQKETKKHKEILEQLYSTKETDIIRAIKQVRDVGDALLLQYLIDLYSNTKSELVKQELVSVFKDLKDQSVVDVLIEAIGNTKDLQLKRILVTACWQSRLYVAEHLKLFAEICISDDYETTIEAFTVIEEEIDSLELSKRVELARYLSGKLSDVSEQKKPLIKELIKVVEPKFTIN